MEKYAYELRTLPIKFWGYHAYSTKKSQSGHRIIIFHYYRFAAFSIDHYMITIIAVELSFAEKA